MLAGKQFFFTQNENNRRIASVVEKRFGLRGKEVEYEWIRRSLRGVWGRAILLWGDGSEHQLSYSFEKKSGFGLKIGADAHTDMAEDGEEPDFRNHFRMSGQENHDVVVFLPHVRGYQVGESIVRHREYTHGHFSADFDFIKGFPCSPAFSTGSGSIGALLEVAGMAIGGNLFRVDMGGMKLKPTEEEFRAGLEAYVRVLQLLEERW